MMGNFPYTPRLQHQGDTEQERNRGVAIPLWQERHGLLKNHLASCVSLNASVEKVRTTLNSECY